MDLPPSPSASAAPAPLLTTTSSEEKLPYIHTKIYWDLITCPLPPRVEEWCAVVGKVTDALRRALDFHFPLPITAYGDTCHMSSSDLATLDGCMSVEDYLNYLPNCSAESKLLAAIEDWQEDMEQMSNYLIITGDPRVFSHFDDLRGRKCNILVAHPDGPPRDGLLSTVCYAWELSSLYRGEAPYHARREMMQLPPPLPCHKPREKLPYIHTKIYWDLITCPLPPCVEEWHAITRNVIDALKRALDFHLPIAITAYGDTFGMSCLDHEILTTCMSANYCSPTRSVESKLIAAIEDWQEDMEQMSNYLIITGDPRVFSHFDDLRVRKCNNILVAHPDGPPPDGLLSTVCYAWELSSLCRGEAPYHARRDMMQLPPPLPCHRPRTTMIYWDLHNCPLPRGEEWSDIVKNVRVAIAKVLKYRDPITIGNTMGITAYGDFINMPVSDYTLLSNLMSSLIHTDVNVSLASKIIAGIEGGREENVMVISGEKKVFDDVEQVRRPNMNIFVAHSEKVLPDLKNSLVAHAWTLSGVFRGEYPYYVGRDIARRRHLDAERARGVEYSRADVEGVYRKEITDNWLYRKEVARRGKECMFSLNTMLQMMSQSKPDPIPPRRTIKSIPGLEHLGATGDEIEVRRNWVARMENFPSLAKAHEIQVWGDWVVKLDHNFLSRHY